MSVRMLHSLEDTKCAATELARELKRGDVVALSGDLGAGKTTLAQFLIRALGDENAEVTSPTFTLLQTYPVTLADGSACTLHHYDLYRIERPEELAQLGMEEAFGELTLIEWPQRMGDSSAVTHALSLHLRADGARELTTARRA